MNWKLLIASVACASVLACERSPVGTTSRPAADGGGGGVETRAEADPNTVSIEAGMLRDLRITVDRVSPRPGGEQMSLLGELAVDQRSYAEVGVPVPARLTRLLASEGEAVRRGQVLAELTSPELGRARADFVSAQAQVTLAEASLARRRDLAAERIVPVREVQEAEWRAAEARAALRSATASIGAFGVDPPSVDSADATSSTFVLRSPVTGTVIARNAVLGQMLDPSEPAFRIGDLSTLWLTVHAFERDAVRVEPGSRARLVFPALPGRDFEGTVAMVGRYVERESRTVPVRIDVRNQSGVLRPGMSSTAVLPVGGPGQPTLGVPVEAVQRVHNQWCVFLPKDDQTFEIRRIGRGRDLGGEVEILFGLDAGETIVVGGAFLLKAQAERGEMDHEAH